MGTARDTEFDLSSRAQRALTLVLEHSSLLMFLSDQRDATTFQSSSRGENGDHLVEFSDNVYHS